MHTQELFLSTKEYRLLEKIAKSKRNTQCNGYHLIITEDKPKMLEIYCSDGVELIRKTQRTINNESIDKKGYLIKNDKKIMFMEDSEAIIGLKKGYDKYFEDLKNKILENNPKRYGIKIKTYPTDYIKLVLDEVFVDYERLKKYFDIGKSFLIYTTKESRSIYVKGEKIEVLISKLIINRDINK